VSAVTKSQLSITLCRTSHPLADPDEHELGGPQRGDADQDRETAVVDVVLRHRVPAAADEERFVGCQAGEGPRAEQDVEK
jgi:hypothetical protein